MHFTHVGHVRSMACLARGCQCTTYVPLSQPRVSGTEEGVWDPHNLPMHSQDCYDTMLEDIASQMTKTACDDLRQHYGISHVSEICQIPSIKLFASFPHEWMHLVLENHVKTLIYLWKGMYKGLDEGKELYVITNGAWVQIGLETAALSAMIPSSFS